MPEAICCGFTLFETLHQRVRLFKITNTVYPHRNKRIEYSKKVLGFVELLEKHTPFCN